VAANQKIAMAAPGTLPKGVYLTEPGRRRSVGLVPMLQTDDMARTRNWYEEVLGFRCVSAASDGGRSKSGEARPGGRHRRGRPRRSEKHGILDEAPSLSARLPVTVASILSDMTHATCAFVKYDGSQR
jgi:catechol 2,3-dioxygenase-like lactoylglutathione lyase family enzyme